MIFVNRPRQGRARSIISTWGFELETIMEKAGRASIRSRIPAPTMARSSRSASSSRWASAKALVRAPYRRRRAVRAAAPRRSDGRPAGALQADDGSLPELRRQYRLRRRSPGRQDRQAMASSRRRDQRQRQPKSLGLVEKPKPRGGPVTAGREGASHPPARGDDSILEQAASAAPAARSSRPTAWAGWDRLAAVPRLKVDAVRHDCGDKAGFVLANLAIYSGSPRPNPTDRGILAKRGTRTIAAAAAAQLRWPLAPHASRQAQSPGSTPAASRLALSL